MRKSTQKLLSGISAVVMSLTAVSAADVAVQASAAISPAVTADASISGDPDGDWKKDIVLKLPDITAHTGYGYI